MSGTFPTSPKAAAITVTSVSPTLVSTTHSFKEQRRIRGGQRWQLDLQFPPMTRAEFAPIYAFIVSQRGQAETFSYAPPVIGSTQGESPDTDTPLVNSPDVGVDPVPVLAGETTIPTDGWTGSVTILKAGDFIKFGNHSKVYMITADVDSDAAGEADITITPPLKSNLADDESISVYDVPFNVRLDSDSAEYDVSPSKLYNLKVNLLEVF
jgi:hypothetical protein